MNEFRCEKCNCDTFKIIKDERKPNMYGYNIGILKCTSCGEERDINKFKDLISTFSKTRIDSENVVNEFTDDIELLQKSIQKLKSLKNNTGELERLLKELKFVYFEENTELINSYKTIAQIINANLPNGIEGTIIIKENEESSQIKLKSSNNDNLGVIKVGRCESNEMNVNVKIGNKQRAESFLITEPFRVIQVLLRIIEILNFNN